MLYQLSYASGRKLLSIRMSPGYCNKNHSPREVYFLGLATALRPATLKIILPYNNQERQER